MQVQGGRRGVLLPGPRIALDAAHEGYASVCSHAHSDHVPWGAARAHATPETRPLLARRAPGLRVDAHPYAEPFDVNGARVTFLPSGHVLGAALTRIEWRGETLLYTADFKLREPLTSEPCARGDDVRADVLVVESTFALPVYQFPTTREARRRAVAFAEDVLAEGGVPVFLGYALGKAQEIAAMLGEAGVPVMLHGAAHAFVADYRAAGHALPNVRAYERDAVDGHALVVPPGARASPMIGNLKHASVAYCSGWAAVESRRFQLQADLLLPLSDHADFPDVCRFVEEVGAERVVANHGYSDVLAHVLRSRGVAAEALHAGEFEEDEVEGAGAVAGPAKPPGAGP